jgi:hypothetical protein
VIYGGKTPGSMLMIMEMNLPMQGGLGAAAGKQQREEMFRAMRQQGQQPGNMNGPLNEVSSETREFTINGQKVPFEFMKGTSPGNGGATRQVVGVFPGRQGTVMLNLVQPESDFKEEEIVKMLGTIRLPDDDSDEDSGMPDEATATETTAGAGSTPAEEKEAEAQTPSESSP